MSTTITCPLCGLENPSDLKVCQRCQTPLSGQSYQPGQSPVRKNTGELEPILPQWLKDARESAKQAGMDEERQQPQANQPAASSPDLLAGLQFQAGDDTEEDVPDWLANITGKPAPKPPQPKYEDPQTETGSVRWVEMGRKDDFIQPEQPQSPIEDEMPPWLTGIQAPAPGEKDELTDWFHKADEKPAAPVSPLALPAIEDSTPDWLKQMSAEAGNVKEESPAETSFETPESSDWLNRIQPAEKTIEPEPLSFEAGAPQADMPDWLKQISEQIEPAAQTPATPEPSPPQTDTPEWFSRLTDETEPAASEHPSTPIETPDWLKDMTADVESVISSQIPEEAPPDAETSDWLTGLAGLAGTLTGMGEPAEAESSTESLAPQEPADKKSDSTPLWLQEAGSPATPAWLESSEEKTIPPNQPPSSAFEDMPDWLKAAAPTSTFDEPTKTETPAPPPSVDAFAGLRDAFAAESSESLFTEMPDWLSQPAESEQAGVIPEPMTGSDALATDALPSWVEAMRPSDQRIQSLGASASDQTLESRGALAGLQGVLPFGAGFAPTSKPKSYAIKLSASEEQQSHAAILEQALAAETAPVPLASERTLAPSRSLRWAIAFLLFISALVPPLINTRIFSTPLLAPPELQYALAVANAIPEDAPVLAVVEYEPSRAGEMEAAAAPLFDNLMILKHPRLTFISSNETGSILVERFLTGSLASHNYQSEVTYLNLGYLAGGQMGIGAFARNPSLAAPRDISGQPAWSLPPLEGVTALDRFAAIILITDNADAARTWVEQTQAARGVVPILVVSSAQAAPMIQPYYDSGQVTGMVSGLYGGAIFESQYNSGRPGTARNYWDSYSIGLLIAMMFTLGGGLLNFALGLRDRAAERAGR